MDRVRDILVAAETGNMEALQSFIDQGQIDCADEEGSTPLMYAAANGQEKAVRQLLESGVDVDHQNHYGWTALLQASCYGHHEVVYTLLKHHADINLCNSWGASPLVAAAQGGFTTVVNGLLDEGAEVRREEEVLSITPLMAAAQCGNEAIVTKLISQGSNVNAQLVATRWTALMLAALNNQGVVVKVLLRHGAVKEMRDVNGNRAVDLAASLGHSKVAGLLPDAGMAISSDIDIFEAVMSGNMDTLSDVLKRSAATANMINKDGATPLMYATRAGNKQAVQLLLDAGADVNVQDHVHGWTAFMHAAHHKHHEVAKLLADRGADVSLRAKNGSNAFDIAHLTRDPSMIQLIASAAIQRLKAAIPRGQHPGQLSTVKEEEKVDSDGGGVKEGVGEPESTEVILNRLSTAFQQKSDEPLSAVDIPDKRGFLTPPQRASPAPTSSFKEEASSSTKPQLSRESGSRQSDPQLVPPTGAFLPKTTPSSPRPRPPQLKLHPPHSNPRTPRSVTPTPFSRHSPIPKSPKSQSANPFSFAKSPATRKDIGALPRGRPMPSFQRNLPQSADVSKTPKFFSSRRSSAELFLSKATPITLRPRAGTSPEKRFTKKLSFEKLKPSPTGPGLNEVLAKSSLSQYLPIFEKEEMDLHSFMTLSEQELEEVGVTNVEDRKALLMLIKSLKTTKSTSAANLVPQQEAVDAVTSAGSKFTFQKL